MKQKANKSARNWEGKGESHQTNRDYSTCVFFIYVQDKFIHLNFFLKRTVQKGKINHWQKKNKKQKKTIIQFCPSVFNVAGFSLYWGTGGGAGSRWGAKKTKTKNKIKHTGRQTGGVLALEIILNISCRIGGTFTRHFFSWEQLLYKCWIMKNPVQGRKQSTVHNPRPRVYKHARSHMTNTLSSQSKPVSSLICLYI